MRGILLVGIVSEPFFRSIDGKLKKRREHCHGIDPLIVLRDLPEKNSVFAVSVAFFVFVSPEILGDFPLIIEKISKTIERNSPRSFDPFSVFVVDKIEKSESLENIEISIIRMREKMSDLFFCDRSCLRFDAILEDDSSESNVKRGKWDLVFSGDVPAMRTDFFFVFHSVKEL